MGNPATPSNETDRLSYLHRLASINSRGWYTHTKASTRVYPSLDAQGGRWLPAGNRPTNHPYICVLKGIPEYILHMLYCRLISNSMGTDLGHRRTNTQRKRKRDGEAAVHAHAFCLTKNPIRLANRFSPRFRASVESASLVDPFERE